MSTPVSLERYGTPRAAARAGSAAASSPALFLALASAASALLALFRLGYQNLWSDEVMSLDVATATTERMWSFFRGLPEQHPVYYFLLRGWVDLFGSSDAALRGLSALFAVASVWVMYPVARALVDERVARIACVVLALSPFHVYFAQDARPYALLGFLTLVAAWAFLAALRDGSRAALALYFVVGTVGAYTHLYFLFFLASHSLYLLWTSRGRIWRGAWRPFAVQLLVVAAYLPWVLFTARNVSPEGQFWKGTDNLLFGAPYTFLRFALGYSEVMANYQWTERARELVTGELPILLPALACAGVLGVAGTAYLLRHARMGALVLFGLVTPIAAALAISLAVMLFGERYLIVAYPWFVVVLSCGVAALWTGRGRAAWAGRGVVIAYALVVAVALRDYYFDPAFGKEQWAEVGGVLSRASTGADLVLVHSGWTLPALTRYYAPPTGQRLVGSGALPIETAPRDSRVWLILSHTLTGEEQLAKLTATHRVVREWLFPHQSGIRLILLDPE